MPSSEFQEIFDNWLDKALAEPIPSSIIAFSFNLAEPWCIEIIGSASFSEDDSDWACNEDFRPDQDELDLPEEELGCDWKTVCEYAKSLVCAYIDRPSPGSNRLREAVAVAVGFVDGDLHKMWPK